MKYYIGLFIVLCACGSEDVGKQSSQWGDYCNITDFPIATNTDCKTITHFTCKDGANWWYDSPALASNYLGTPCYSDPTQTYVYVCVIDEIGIPQVRCSK